MSDIHFTAKSLEDIANTFTEKAAVAEKVGVRALTVRDRLLLSREAWTWREAADILRKTTIEEKKP